MTKFSMTELEIEQQFPRTFAVIREGIDRQLHMGCQLYVSQQANREGYDWTMSSLDLFPNLQSVGRIA